MLQRQHLFSVYLHPLPDFGSFPEESIFHGREIQERIQVCDSLHPSDRARALMWGGYPNCDYTRLDAYHRSLAGSKTRPGMLLGFILHPGLPVCRSPLLCLRHCLLSHWAAHTVVRQDLLSMSVNTFCFSGVVGSA